MRAIFFGKQQSIVIKRSNDRFSVFTRHADPISTHLTSSVASTSYSSSRNEYRNLFAQNKHKQSERREPGKLDTTRNSCCHKYLAHLAGSHGSTVTRVREGGREGGGGRLLHLIHHGRVSGAMISGERLACKCNSIRLSLQCVYRTTCWYHRAAPAVTWKERTSGRLLQALVCQQSQHTHCSMLNINMIDGF